MDMTFGFGRQDQDVLGPDFQAGNYGLDVLGIPGTNDQGIGDQRYAGYPRFQTGFSDAGNRDGWNPIYRDERTYSLTANLTKVKGSHDFRTGYTLNFLYLDHWQPETGNPRGHFNFLGNTTALHGGQTANFYNQWASFMLGLIGTANKSLQNELMTGREWQHAVVFPRSLDPERQADARPRAAVGVLPHHAPRRRSRHRSCRSGQPPGSGGRAAAATIRTTG